MNTKLKVKGQVGRPCLPAHEKTRTVTFRLYQHEIDSLRNLRNELGVTQRELFNILLKHYKAVSL